VEKALLARLVYLDPLTYMDACPESLLGAGENRVST